MFGVVAPVFAVIATVVSIYLPGFLVNPRYDFVYFKPGVMNSVYHVEKDRNGKGTIKKRSSSSNKNADTTLYVYDVSSRSSRVITFEEAETLNIDSSSTSPDGFTVIGAGKDRKDYRSRYLQKGAVRKKINIDLVGPSYFNFQIVGWIVKTDL